MKCFIYISLAVFALDQAKWVRSKIFPSNFDAMNSEYINKTISRIVGGEEAAPNSFPYQAGLFIKFYRNGVLYFYGFCGGSIISKNFIVTSAFCVDRPTIRLARSAKVVLGAHKIEEKETTQKTYTSTEFIVHPKWNPENIQSPDIALIKLPRSIRFTYAIKPIRLPKYQNDKLYGRLAAISGWGHYSDQSAERSPVLRFVNTTIITLRWCKIYWRKLGDDHVCTSGSGGKGACISDEGGPMVTEDKHGEITLDGIVSHYSSTRCERGWPTVFTRVGGYVDWIRSKANMKLANDDDDEDHDDYSDYDEYETDDDGYSDHVGDDDDDDNEDYDNDNEDYDNDTEDYNNDTEDYNNDNEDYDNDTEDYNNDNEDYDNDNEDYDNYE